MYVCTHACVSGIERERNCVFDKRYSINKRLKEEPLFNVL